MKTELTPEESAKLIELGVDPKLASMVSWKSTKDWQGNNINENNKHLVLKPFRPAVMGFESFDCKDIFTLTDILAILPKGIRHKEGPYGLCMEYDCDWEVSYFNMANFLTPNKEGFIAFAQASELIDALNQLLIWCIANGHYNPKNEEK